MATTTSTASGSSRGREDARLAGRTEEERHLAALRDQLVGEPDQRGAADPAADEQHVVDALARLVAAPERADDADRVARRAAREPVRAAPDHVEEQRELRPSAALAQAVERAGAAEQRVVVLADVGHHELARPGVAELLGHRQPEDVRLAVEAGGLGDLDDGASHAGSPVAW